METSLEKYVLQKRKRRKIQITEGIALPPQERIRTPREKENYKYFGILESDTIKQQKSHKRYKHLDCPHYEII